MKKDTEYKAVVTLTGKQMDNAARTSQKWASEKAYVPNRNIDNIFRFAMTHDWYDDTSALQLIGR